MKPLFRLKRVGTLALVLAAVVAVTARATGPLYVGGPGAVPGVPYRWTINPLTYWTDLGNLGTQTTQQADTMVAQSFQVWQDAPTANIKFTPDPSNGGKLGGDVTASKILAVLNAIQGCGPLGSIAKDRSIIYDVDGSAVAAYLGQGNENNALGFASAACLGSNGVDSNYFQRGYAVLNGRFLDGIDSFSNPEVTPADFKAVMIHEFGHMLGLDHSQINLDCLTVGTGAPGCDLQGLPTMFPIAVDYAEMSTLATDDIAGISALYPGASFTSMGSITGRVFFSDGQIPAQGFNVIARKTDNPLVTAVSSVSGFLFTASAGNAVQPWSSSSFGSRNPALIGYYVIPGLPPGDYTVEVEAINNSGAYPFVFGSGLEPFAGLGFQFPLPSLLPTLPPCADEYLVSSATATCDSAAATVIPVAAGSTVSTGTDVILIATPPRYDAWEDGP